MTAADLAAADPIAAMLAWLRQHPRVLAEFGDASRVAGTNEAPYPRVMVSPSAGGDDRDLIWLLEPEISVVTYGEPDGTPGQAELRRLHYVVLAAATEIVGWSPPPTIGVTSLVRSSSAARWEAEPLTGEPAWRSTLVMRIHPPSVAAIRLGGRGTLSASS